MQVRIDVERNRLTVAGREFKGSHRWEALCLAALLSAPSSGLSCAELQATLRGAGQARPLDRTGLRRLLVGLQALLDAALGTVGAGCRIRYAPRHLTVGPWQLDAEAAISWDYVAPLAPAFWAGEAEGAAPLVATDARDAGGSTSPAITLFDPEEFSSSLAPIELLFKADALFVSGHMKDAASLLQTAAASRWVTCEGWGLLQLRLARVHKRRGLFDEAEEVLTQVLDRCRAKGLRDPGLLSAARHLQRRVRYDRRPVDLTHFGTDPAFGEILSGPDPRVMGEAENLEALVLRRKAGLAAAAGDSAQATRLLHESLRRMAAAIYWAASARDHENCQNFAFNLGLVNSSLHQLGADTAAVAAFRSYRLGLQLREDFYLGRDSVWDHICIGQLWLGLPDHRAEFESELAFELPKLSEPEFYVHAVDHAAALGDPRQLALCCVNLWRFAREAPVAAQPNMLRELAKGRLRSLLQTQGELLETLRSDAPDVIDELLGPGLLSPAA